MAKKQYKYRKKIRYNGYIIDVKSDDLDDFAEKIKKRKEEIDKNLVRSDISFNQWKYKYLETYKRDVSIETYENYERVLQHLDFPQPVREIRQIQIQNLFNSYGGKSKSLVHKMLFLCKDIFEQAAENGIIERNPCKKIFAPAGNENERRPLTDQEKHFCIRAAAKHEYGTYFMLMLFAGLRPIEASNVRGCDIDLEKKQLLVHGAKARKNENKDRIVPICDPLIPFLENIKYGQHVIYDSTGRPLSNDTRRNKWRSFVRAINIEMGAPMANNKILDPYFDKEVTAYYLRHTFNVDCVSAKVPWIIKEQFMGHSLKKKTLGYDHLTDRNIEIGRQLLNEFHICNLGKVKIDRLNNYAEKNCIIPRR